MLLQTNSYIVPEDRRAEHARLIRRFRQALLRIGCDQFEVYEQVGANWSPAGSGGRFVQIMRFRDRQHQQAVQTAERNDPGSQQIIAEFCDLINFPYQQQYGYFSSGFYVGLLASASRHVPSFEPEAAPESEEYDGSYVDGESQVEEQADESQQEVAPQAEGEADFQAEQDAEPLAEAEEQEPPAKTGMPDAANAEPLLEEADTVSDSQMEPDAAEVEEESPGRAVAVESIEAEPSPEETAFDFDDKSAADPIEPALERPSSDPEPSVETPGPGAATQPLPEESTEDAGAALISFLDSLTQEDLTADESVAGEIDAEGHVRQVDPDASPSFAEESIAPVEQEANELVTADEFAPAESAEAAEAEQTVEFSVGAENDSSATSELDPQAIPATSPLFDAADGGNDQLAADSEFETEKWTAMPESAISDPSADVQAEAEIEPPLDENFEILSQDKPEAAAERPLQVGPESRSLLVDETRTVSNHDDRYDLSPAHREASGSFDLIFDDPELMEQLASAIHDDPDDLLAQHSSRHIRPDAASDGHASSDGEEDSIDFEALLSELDGPSADAAHR